MKEEWRPIKDYEGIYEISSLGRIKRLKRKVWNGKKYCIRPTIILRPSMKSGYYRVRLYKNQICKEFYIHRLLMQTFVKESNKQVNHINGIKTDNSLSNLEYCTSSENMKHAYRIGLVKFYHRENAYGTKITKEMVRLIRNSITLTHQELSEIFNISVRHIGRILSMKSWKTI